MCPSRKILNQSKNGTLTFCSHSKLFQVVYNNLCFEYYEWELDAFKKYIDTLDIKYWEEQLKCTFNHRKIPISLGLNHFIILVDRHEIHELKELLNIDNAAIHFIGYDEINYHLIEN
ncbi:DUF6686 family protein [Allomuricauda sp. d1]|uniref:DUF6686 family protein n=1 Tax=Allomuricauda sp. d1 TaxID=3136725 RepID=UPI0031D5543D